MNSRPVDPGCGWDGWYFEEGYFCSPAGDRFTPLAIMACHFYRQMEGVRSVMYWRPQVVKTVEVHPDLGQLIARQKSRLKDVDIRHETRIE
jgi:hypothetical protein